MVNRIGSLRSTVNGGAGGTGSEPTIIADGENIVSQSIGFDTRATTGGVGNVNIGNSTINEARDDNWIEGLDNNIDGTDNFVYGNENSIENSDNIGIFGKLNLIENSGGSNVLGNQNDISQENVNIIGSLQKDFAANTHLKGFGLNGIPTRTDLPLIGEEGFPFRSGDLCNFLSNEIDLTTLATFTWNFEPGSQFGLLYFSFFQINNSNDGATDTKFRLTDGLANLILDGTIPVGQVGKFILKFDSSITQSYYSDTLIIEIYQATDNTTQTGRFLISGLLSDLP